MDQFESRYMRDEAKVLYRDKRVSRGMAVLFAIVGVLVMALGGFIGVANATAPKPLPAAALPLVIAALVALGLLFIAIGVVFAVVRTLVTERDVHVKYGLWGPRIPLEAIRSCAVVDYNAAEFGGWGLRFGPDGARAYVPSGGRVVELRYDDGGRERRVLIGVGDPNETARRINEARPKSRVAAPNETEVETLDEDETAAEPRTRGAQP